MPYTIHVDTLNKELDVSRIKDLLVRNSALADVIDIIIPRTYEGVELMGMLYLTEVIGEATADFTLQFFLRGGVECQMSVKTVHTN